MSELLENHCLLLIYRATTIPAVGPLASLLAHGHGQTGYSPLGNPLFKAAGREAPFAEELDGVNGEDAVRPPTIRDNLLVCRQLGQAPLKLLQRN